MLSLDVSFNETYEDILLKIVLKNNELFMHIVLNALNIKPKAIKSWSMNLDVLQINCYILLSSRSKL